MLRFILSIAVLGTLSCSKDAPVSPPSAGKAIADDVASDRAILETFYKATGGDNWKDNTNWLSENAASLLAWRWCRLLRGASMVHMVTEIII